MLTPYLWLELVSVTMYYIVIALWHLYFVTFCIFLALRCERCAQSARLRFMHTLSRCSDFLFISNAMENCHAKQNALEMIKRWSVWVFRTTRTWQNGPRGPIKIYFNNWFKLSQRRETSQKIYIMAEKIETEKNVLNAKVIMRVPH